MNAMTSFSNTRKAILIGISGTALQWYDFAIFGYFAVIIAHTFFPEQNQTAALLSAFAAFAVGYILSPLGSLFFGYIGDYYGRKRALIISILGMAVATALLSVMPSYAKIGIVAPILVTILRMLQGFVASSEFSGSAIFLVEYAKPSSKAFYGCLTSAAYSVGVLCAGLMASLLTASFMPSWAWRIGFIVALIAGMIIFYFRSSVLETPVYQSIPQNKKSHKPLLQAIQYAPYAFLGVIGMAAFVGIMTYGTYVFTATYMHIYFNIPLSVATLMTTLALAVDAILEPIFALIADKVGFKKIMLLGICLIFVFIIPIFHLLSSSNIIFMTIAMILMSLFIAIAFAPINAYMITLFPETCRYSGFGVAFHIGMSLFGGTTPLVLIWLVNKTGNFIMPAYYFMAGAILCIFSLAICEYDRRKQKQISFRHE